MRLLSLRPALAAIIAAAVSGCAASSTSSYVHDPAAQEWAERNRNAQIEANREVYGMWSRELQAVQAEDRAAVAQRFPLWGWTAGLWCESGQDGLGTNVRIELLDGARARIARLHRIGGKREDPAASYTLTGWIGHIRSNEGAIELWAREDGGAYDLWQIRKGARGALLMGGVRLAKDTVNTAVPFSGTPFSLLPHQTFDACAPK